MTEVIDVVKAEPKPGIRSTEFWLTSGTSLLVVAAAALGTEVSEETAVVIVSGLVALYTLVRGFVKR